MATTRPFFVLLFDYRRMILIALVFHFHGPFQRQMSRSFITFLPKNWFFLKITKFIKISFCNKKELNYSNGHYWDLKRKKRFILRGIIFTCVVFSWRWNIKCWTLNSGRARTRMTYYNASYCYRRYAVLSVLSLRFFLKKCFRAASGFVAKRRGLPPVIASVHEMPCY